jgi:general secretion pathway protein G
LRETSSFPVRRGFTLVELLAVSAIIAAVATLAIPRVQDSVERARVTRAMGEIRALQSDLDGQDSLPDGLSGIGRAGMLDPWGNAYEYNKFDKTKGVPQGARRDRFLVPINSSYDLYSKGRDGDSHPPLNAKASLDDVIRANDGGFVGLAARF